MRGSSEHEEWILDHVSTLKDKLTSPDESVVREFVDQKLVRQRNFHSFMKGYRRSEVGEQERIEE